VDENAVDKAMDNQESLNLDI